MAAVTKCDELGVRLAGDEWAEFYGFGSREGSGGGGPRMEVSEKGAHERK